MPAAGSNGVRVYGRYIVEDPRICHGQMTFKGTRIFVSSVLEEVAEGLDWDSICSLWRGKVTKPAIAEAVRLAHEALQTRGVDPVILPEGERAGRKHSRGPARAPARTKGAGASHRLRHRTSGHKG